MLLNSPSEVAEQIAMILNDGPCCLFAGAGVSARAGLPVWDRYLGLLADEADAYEPMIAGLMRKRITSNLLLEAAGYFKSCADIPEGEKLKLISSPLKNYDAKALWPLCSLPFTLAATTNYDRALHDAFGRQRDNTPLCVELDDSTFKEALFWKEFYIARIHGRVELPDSMILDNNDYAHLYSDDEYQDFLRSLLVQHRFIFVGFSFLDPAVSKVLQFLKARRIFPKLHYAFLPTGNQGLAEEMAAHNIRIFTYPAEGNDHAVLWDGIGEAAINYQQALSSLCTPVTASFDTAKRLLATCYASASMGDEGGALRQLVVDGIVVSELSSGASQLETLVSKLRGYMALSEGEAGVLVDSSVFNLVKKGICMQDGNTIVLVDDRPATSPVQVLAEGVVARLRLREKFEIKETILSSVSNIVEEVIVLRGFDLGAEFSGASLRNEVDVFDTISMTIDRHLGNYWQDKKRALAEVFREMLRHPDKREEALLGELGRIAFGIEIVLQAGRSTMYALSLPQIVYLDASVLLPAIVPGHPFRRVYLNAITKLQDAARSSGGTIVQIADVFLDEVVNHRRKAIEFVKAGGLDDRETLQRRILFYGADRMNVFIGAYSRWTPAENEGKASFETFLAQEAPYESIGQLKGFLSKQGFKVAPTKPKDPADASRLAAFERALDTGYDIEEALLDRRELKVSLLKKHEAAQLFSMHLDMEAGRRPILVTADTKLRRAVGLCSISSLKDSLISPQNLVQLVDLLIGIDVPPASLARLLWSVKAVDDAAMLKDYLLSRALPTYNEALLLKMNELLDSYVDQYLKQAKLEKINLMATGTEESLKTSRFMDRVENEVFANMAIEVEKLKRRLRELEGKQEAD
jgi:hypothetical protein